jgi:uncharacterized protein YjbJ (UPF0337 family)
MMNWNLAQASWQQFKGTVKARWLKLTDEQLEAISGNRAQLLEKLQASYGISRSDAERELRAFEARHKNDRPKS